MILMWSVLLCRMHNIDERITERACEARRDQQPQRTITFDRPYPLTRVEVKYPLLEEKLSKERLPL